MIYRRHAGRRVACMIHTYIDQEYRDFLTDYTGKTDVGDKIFIPVYGLLILILKDFGNIRVVHSLIDIDNSLSNLMI